jgi:hypothetical protein
MSMAADTHRFTQMKTEYFDLRVAACICGYYGELLCQ